MASSTSQRLISEFKNNPKPEPKAALIEELSNNIPEMPTELVKLIADYRLPHPRDYADALLKDFNDLNSRMPFALDDLTKEERDWLLASEHFPTPLKFYYYTEEEFARAIKEPLNEEFEKAIIFGVWSCEAPEIDRDQMADQRDYLTRHNGCNKAGYEQLCKEYPQSLIENLKMRLMLYAKHTKLSDSHQYLSTVILLYYIKQWPQHLNLPHADLYLQQFQNINMSGANLKGARLPASTGSLFNASLRGADLREADAKFSVNAFVNCDLREANLTGINLQDDLFMFHKADLLGIIIDDETKKRILKFVKLKIDETDPHFTPLFNYFNSFRHRLNWDEFVHANRIMRATDIQQFEAFKRDIPASLTTTKNFFGRPTPTSFKKALDQVENNLRKLTPAVRNS